MLGLGKWGRIATVDIAGKALPHIAEQRNPCPKCRAKMRKSNKVVIITDDMINAATFALIGTVSESMNPESVALAVFMAAMDCMEDGQVEFSYGEGSPLFKFSTPAKQ